MHWMTPYRSRRALGRDATFSSFRGDEPHAITVTDFAVACAALDLGCATWSSHQVDVVVVREEEGSRAVSERHLDGDLILPH